MTDEKGIAVRIRDAILADVTDRRGWRQAWNSFDDDIQDEIKATWLETIQTELSRPTPAKFALQRLEKAREQARNIDMYDMPAAVDEILADLRAGLTSPREDSVFGV